MAEVPCLHLPCARAAPSEEALIQDWYFVTVAASEEQVEYSLAIPNVMTVGIGNGFVCGLSRWSGLVLP
jgi:hypothetical protein